MKIIDAHCHVFPEKIAAAAVKNLEEYYTVPMECVGTVADLERDISGTPVCRCVVHSTATKVSQVEAVNNFIAGIQNERFLGFGTIHPEHADVAGEVARIKKMGLHGVKLHPDFQSFAIDDAKAMPIYEAARAENLPVLVHLGDENTDYSKPRRLRRVLDAFPGLQVIGAHMGGYLDWDEAEDCLYGQDLYFDTCSVIRVLGPQKMTALIRKHPIDRILFGTDYPMESHATCLAQMASLALRTGEQEAIFYENARRLLGLAE